jgi:hypothetical protein
MKGVDIFWVDFIIWGELFGCLIETRDSIFQVFYLAFIYFKF